MPTCRYPGDDRWIDGRIVVRRDEWSWSPIDLHIALPISEIYLDVTSWAGDRIFFFFYLMLQRGHSCASVKLLQLVVAVAGGGDARQQQARPGKGVGD